MLDDPIVDEIHKVRERLAAQFNFDVSSIFADMRTRERSAGERVKNRQTIKRKTTHPSGGSSAPGRENISPATG